MATCLFKDFRSDSIDDKQHREDLETIIDALKSLAFRQSSPLNKPAQYSMNEKDALSLLLDHLGIDCQIRVHQVKNSSSNSAFIYQKEAKTSSLVVEGVNHAYDNSEEFSNKTFIQQLWGLLHNILKGFPLLQFEERKLNSVRINSSGFSSQMNTKMIQRMSKLDPESSIWKSEMIFRTLFPTLSDEFNLTDQQNNINLSVHNPQEIKSESVPLSRSLSFVSSRSETVETLSTLDIPWSVPV